MTDIIAPPPPPLSFVHGTRLVCVVGPMGSGKTTEATRRGRVLANKHRVMFIGHVSDITRMGTDVVLATDTMMSSPFDGWLQTHDEVRTPAIMCTKLMDLVSLPVYTRATWIVIDEAHFFPDLVWFISKARNVDGKSLVVACLDADKDMQPFVDLGYLVPHATEFVKLVGICSFCEEPAAHTIAKTSMRDRVVVGGMDTYWPVCYYHATVSKSELDGLRPRRGEVLCRLCDK
jgi:thymidine kinase